MFTDHFIRFERVSSVAQTPHGLLATLHGEQLRVDLVRPDLVRVKISRGGEFDESPTFAVCVDPLADAVEFTYSSDGEQARLTRTDTFAAPVRLAPDTSVVQSRVLASGDLVVTHWIRSRKVGDPTVRPSGRTASTFQRSSRAAPSGPMADSGTRSCCSARPTARCTTESSEVRTVTV